MPHVGLPRIQTKVKLPAEGLHLARTAPHLPHARRDKCVVISVPLLNDLAARAPPELHSPVVLHLASHIAMRLAGGCGGGGAVAEGGGGDGSVAAGGVGLAGGPSGGLEELRQLQVGAYSSAPANAHGIAFRCCETK